MIIQVEKLLFITNPNEVDENGNLTDLAVIHGQMEKDFEDESKLEYFKQLLSQNPNTAFTIYNNG